MIVQAPFTTEQAEAINLFQTSGYMHPFTCGNRERHFSAVDLVATEQGLHCPEPECDYTQDWVYAHMADLAAVRQARAEHDRLWRSFGNQEGSQD